MYAPTTLPQKEVEIGAIADPSYLSGRAAAVDIFPGQQFTATDFAASDTASVDSQITGTQRALSISIDHVHGSLSQVQPGDSVDVYMAVAGVVKLFRAERQGAHHSDDPRPERQCQPRFSASRRRTRRQWAYAADNTQLCFVLRPVVGAKPTKPSTANAATVLR